MFIYFHVRTRDTIPFEREADLFGLSSTIECPLFTMPATAIKRLEKL
jgi:hypothetical protein